MNWYFIRYLLLLFHFRHFHWLLYAMIASLLRFHAIDAPAAIAAATAAARRFRHTGCFHWCQAAASRYTPASAAIAYAAAATLMPLTILIGHIIIDYWHYFFIAIHYVDSMPFIADIFPTPFNWYFRYDTHFDYFHWFHFASSISFDIFFYLLLSFRRLSHTHIYFWILSREISRRLGFSFWLHWWGVIFRWQEASWFSLIFIDIDYAAVSSFQPAFSHISPAFAARLATGRAGFRFRFRRRWRFQLSLS